jgi:hypothetical protein
MRMLRAASLAVLTLLFVGDGDPHRAGASCNKVRSCSGQDSHGEQGLAGMSCAALARMRAAIDAENGHCGRRGAWRATLSGGNCRSAEAAAMPSRREGQDKAHAIRRAEQAKGCGGA